MPILTTIDGVPLFNTIREALDWGYSVGLTGYHTHQYLGKTGYMGGVDHNNAVTGNVPLVTPQQTTLQQPDISQFERTGVRRPQPPQQTFSTGGSGGSSGGSGSGY